ncbi:hypothetical protein DL769_002222 [Monosporascus sp. CRB-8-3]|nr:hypothetical protein DL769_002222 [Monosporascus sp. CRB-8-3]
MKVEVERSKWRLGFTGGPGGEELEKPSNEHNQLEWRAKRRGQGALRLEKRRDQKDDEVRVGERGEPTASTYPQSRQASWWPQEHSRRRDLSRRTLPALPVVIRRVDVPVEELDVALDIDIPLVGVLVEIPDVIIFVGGSMSVRSVSEMEHSSSSTSKRRSSSGENDASES